MYISDTSTATSYMHAMMTHISLPLSFSIGRCQSIFRYFGFPAVYARQTRLTHFRLTEERVLSIVNFVCVCVRAGWGCGGQVYKVCMCGRVRVHIYAGRVSVAWGVACYRVRPTPRGRSWFSRWRFGALRRHEASVCV